MKNARQLAAIMFTDIEGYTAMMQLNEEKAIQVRNKHRHIFNSATEKYRGKILQYYGDGTLSIFDSAIDAVTCGIEMQLGFQKDPSIPVRIGIHTGDIIFSEEEIIGDSVNVASRIESLSVPGSVFISDKVYDEIKNQESIKTSMLKTYKLKNVEKPIEVYAISNVGLIVPKPTDNEENSNSKTPSLSKKETLSEHEKVATPILATKLFIPPPRSKAVLRTHLIEQLHKGLHRRLTLICAPAGFGKTTLASEWITGCEQTALWLSLDERDNDLTRFLAYIIASLQSISEKIGEGVLSVLLSTQPPSIESMMTVLLNDISSIKENFILVLDDYHVINAEPVNSALTFLLDHQPPQMHVVITTRQDPQLPLPRLRARGLLTELRIKDLRFTRHETTEFLKHVMDLNLSAENIALLEASTEGWVAGLQMAALSMQGRSDITGFIKDFAGDDRHIIDYLVEEVLQNQPDRVQNFLLQTSILDRLIGPLCNAITEQNDGKSMLEALERGNLFVVPLDDKRQWYRYHHLFAEVLQSRLLDEQPNLVTSLHHRASVWYEKNGLSSESIGHAISSLDLERAADLIEMAWPEMDKTVQSATWLSWIKAIPEELIRVRPVLCVGYAWALLMEGDLETCEDHLQVAEQWLEPTTEIAAQDEFHSSKMVVVDQNQFRALPATIATARAYHNGALGDLSGTIKYAQQALDLIEDDHYMRATPAALLGLTHLTIGDLESAYRSFTDVMACFQLTGDFALAIGMTYFLADIRKAQGRLHDAVYTYEQSLKLAKEQGDLILRGAADLYLGLSELYREQGNTKAAGENLLRAQELSGYSSLADWPYCLCLARARIKKAEGDMDGAVDLFEEAERLYFRTPMPEISPVSALKTRIWIVQGKLTKALDWVTEQKLSADDDLSYLHEFEHITLARVLISLYKNKRKEDQIHDALKLLDRLLVAAEEGGRQGSMIEILILLALAHQVQDDTISALMPLERALALAEPEGYVRIFVDEGKLMTQLLDIAYKKEIMPNYIDKLMTVYKSEKVCVNQDQPMMQ